MGYLTILYGTAENLERNNIVLWARKALKDSQELNIIDDQFRSPTLAEDLAYMLFSYEKEAIGVQCLQRHNEYT